MYQMHCYEKHDETCFHAMPNVVKVVLKSYDEEIFIQKGFHKPN